MLGFYLNEPHGYLLWKGKKTAVGQSTCLAPEGVGVPLIVVSGKEAFGVITLGQPASMTIAQFDRAEFFEQHRIRPEERRAWWPDAKTMFVYPIRSFERYPQPRPVLPTDGKSIIPEVVFKDPIPVSPAAQDILSRAARLPKTIRLADCVLSLAVPDEASPSGLGLFLDETHASLVKTHQPEIDHALQAVFEVPGDQTRYGLLPADTKHLPVYSLALVRAPRLEVEQSEKYSPGQSRDAGGRFAGGMGGGGVSSPDKTSGGKITSGKIVDSSLHWQSEESIRGHVVIEHSASGEPDEEAIAKFVSGDLRNQVDAIHNPKDIESIKVSNIQHGQGYLSAYVRIIPTAKAGDRWLNMQQQIEEGEIWGGGKQFLGEKQHTGAMIALYPDNPAVVPLPSGEDLQVTPADELHVTMAYLGTAADITPTQLQLLRGACTGLASQLPIIQATLGGTGRFTATEDDGTNAFYASVDSPAIEELRGRLVAILSALDLLPDSTHGFTAHMTLAYVPQSAPTPDLAIDKIPVTFSKLALTRAGKTESFPLLSTKQFSGEPDVLPANPSTSDDLATTSPPGPLLDGRLPVNDYVYACPQCQKDYGSPVALETPGPCPDCIALGAEDDKAGRRLRSDKVDLVSEIQSMWSSLGDKLREFMGWAKYEEEPEVSTQEPQDEMPMDLAGMMGFYSKDHPSGIGVKEINGKPWLITYSTNAFVDREDEAFSTAALEKWAAEAIGRDVKGFWNLWHIPNSDFAQKQWVAVPGRILVEAGPFLDTPLGQAAAKFFQQYPVSHPTFAPEGWGCSPEYRYLPEERKTGVYQNIEITRTSVLPRFAAANLWTATTVKEITMKLTDDQKKLGEAIFGAEGLQAIVTGAEKATEDLEQTVAYKGVSETPAAPEATPPAETPAAEPAPQTEPAEADKNCGDVSMGVPIGVTTFAQLDALHAAQEAAEEATDRTNQFTAIVANIMSAPDITNKQSALSALAAEYSKLVAAEMGGAKAQWTAAYIGTLPDASFLYVEPGGEKDEEGMTTPRALRHLPYADKTGKVDLPHLRNALSRLGQPDTGKGPEGKWLTADLRDSLMAKARKILEDETSQKATPEPVPPTPAEAAVPPVSVEQIADMIKQIKFDPTPLQAMVESLAAEVQALKGRLDRSDQLAEAMKSTSMPRFAATLFERATQAVETEVTQDDKDLKDAKPAETTPRAISGSLAATFHSGAH